MSIESRWLKHTSETGTTPAHGHDVNRPIDARRCTVQLSTGRLYLDVVASPKTALLGHDLPLIASADGPKVQQLLSKLAPGYACHAMTSSFYAASEFAARLGQSAPRTQTCVVERNALDGEPASVDGALIAHENETLGRTGRWLASSAWKRTPDLIVIGETIALGYPFGAVLIRDGFAAEVNSDCRALEVDQVVGLSALARVKAAMVTVEREGLLQQGLDVAQYLMERLSAMREYCPQIESIQGTGLSIRVTFNPPLKALEVRRKMCERGVLAGVDAAGRLAIDPPLALRIAEADVVTGALRGALLDLPMVSASACCPACAEAR